jgi:hypothetical protein
MAERSLTAVVRLRRVTLDQARVALTVCVQAEECAARDVAQAEAAIERERRAATDLALGDSAVESFGLWLKTGRKTLERAQVRHAAAISGTIRARAELTAARTAMQAAEEVLAIREAAAEAEAALRDRAALDELGLAAKAKKLDE